MGLFTDAITGTFSAIGGACAFLPYCELLLIGFKLIMLLLLVSWVRGHLGGGMISTIAVLLFGYLILFPYFYIFGPITFLYLLIIIGAANIVQDVAFGGGHYNPMEEEGMMHGPSTIPGMGGGMAEMQESMKKKLGRG